MHMPPWTFLLVAPLAAYPPLSSEPDADRHGRVLFTPGFYANTMVMSALVTLGGVEQASGVLTAFAGTDVRGLQDTPSIPPFGPYVGKAIFQITLYADVAGEMMSFTFFTGSVTVSLAETFTFSINGNAGSVVDPFLLSGTLASATMPPPSPPPPSPLPPPSMVVCLPPPSPPSPLPSLPPLSVSPPPPASLPMQIFDPRVFSNSMVVTALVMLTGVDQSSGVLTAFVGTEVRGLQDSPSTPPFGPYAGRTMFLMTLYAEVGGETVSFSFFTVLFLPTTD